MQYSKNYYSQKDGKKKMPYFWINFFLIIFLIIAFRQEILSSYFNFFIVDTTNSSKKDYDAIMILSGDITTRAQEGIELFQSGYSDKIYISTTKKRSNLYSHILKTKTELIKEIMEFENVQIDYIPSYKDGATSTLDEAKDMAYFLKQNPMKKILLVTNDFHSKRALYIFNKIFKKNNINTIVDIKAIMSNRYDSYNWYMNENSLLNFAILEPLKLILYYFIDDNLIIVKNE